MSDIIHAGLWHLPNSNKKFSGHLTSDEKSITLKIFGQEYIEGSNAIDDKNSKIENYHSIILGDARGLFTLYDCRWSGTKLIGEGLCQIIYKVNFAFMGCHIISKEAFKIKSGTFTFPHIASCFDGDKSITRIPVLDENGISTEGINQGESERQELIVNEDLTLIFFDVYEKHYESFGFHHSLKYDKRVTFMYNKEVSFKKLITDASKLRKLIEFSCSKPLRYKIFDITIDKSCALKIDADYYENKFYRVFIWNLTLMKGIKIEQSTANHCHLLLGNWNTTNDFSNAIIKWFSNNEFENVYDFYLDSNNWFQDSEAVLSNVMFNNRFLNLIQGLEAYYNKSNKKKRVNKDFENNKSEVLKLIDDSNLKEWTKANLLPLNITLKEKILWIHNEFNTIIRGLFTDNILLKDFPNYAKEIRNKLSHGTNDETNLGNELHTNFFIARILLCICILKTLNVENIAEKIARNLEFSRNIYEVKLTSLK